MTAQQPIAAVTGLDLILDLGTRTYEIPILRTELVHLIAVPADRPERRAVVFDDIDAERKGQDSRFWEGSIAGPVMTLPEKFAVMMEEVGEVAEAIVMQIGGGRYREGREHHSDNLRGELIQLAACAVGMVEGLDRAAAQAREAVAVEGPDWIGERCTAGVPTRDGPGRMDAHMEPCEAVIVWRSGEWMHKQEVMSGGKRWSHAAEGPAP